MKYGLIGYPLGHSVSPQLHRMLGCTDYSLCPLAPEELGPFLEKEPFSGLNVTIPYKQAVLPYCQRLSPLARAIGSVNTLVREADGTLSGYNTDYAGLSRALAQLSLSLGQAKVVILGTGGAARNAHALAQAEGAAGITLVSRSGPVDYKTVYGLEDTDLLINATPVGMYPRNEEQPVDLARFPRLKGMLDLIYNPLRSRLLLQGEALGLVCGNGLLMLAQQAKAAEELFQKRPLPEESASRAARQLERDMTNIVLIGMPGCGKTTLGKALAQQMGRPFLDTDALVEEETGRIIPQIFAEAGETAFRKLEAEAVAKAAAQTGLVLACGGGAVLSPENRLALRQNGRCYFLERNLDELAREGRPLSAAPEAVARLAREREPIYRRLADQTVRNDGWSLAADAIKEDFYAHFGNQRA